MNYTIKLCKLLKKVKDLRFNKNERSQLASKLYDCLILVGDLKFIFISAYFTDSGELSIGLMESRLFESNDYFSVSEVNNNLFLNKYTNNKVLDIKFVDPIFLNRFAEIIDTELIVNKHLKKLNSITTFKKINTELFTALVNSANLRSYAVNGTSFKGLYEDFNCSIDCEGHKTSLYVSLREAGDFFYISIQFGNNKIRNQLGVCGITSERGVDFIPLHVRYVESKFFYAVHAYVRILTELDKKQIKRQEKESL